MGPEEGALDFETVIGQLQALASEDHPFKTVVIDSITKLFNTAVANEAERLGAKDAFGASKKPAVAFMRRLVAWIQRLDMNVVLISHHGGHHSYPVGVVLYRGIMALLHRYPQGRGDETGGQRMPEILDALMRDESGSRLLGC